MHHADGQYQASEFQRTLQNAVNLRDEDDILRTENASKVFVLPWDTAHWIDCAMTDIRENEEDGKCLRLLIKRTNKFQNMFGQGRGFAEYKGYAEKHNLKSNVPKAFSTTRFLAVLSSHF